MPLFDVGTFLFSLSQTVHWMASIEESTEATISIIWMRWIQRIQLSVKTAAAGQQWDALVSKNVITCATTQVKCRASLFNLTNRQELKEEEICSMSSQLTPRIVYCCWGNRPRKARVMFSAAQLFGSVSVSPMNGHYFQFRMRRQVDMIVEKGKDLASSQKHKANIS